jgi:hypothetical protein
LQVFSSGFQRTLVVILRIFLLGVTVKLGGQTQDAETPPSRSSDLRDGRLRPQDQCIEPKSQSSERTSAPEVASDSELRQKVASGARAMLWLVRADDCSGYGSVEIGQDGAVRAFHEKRSERRTGTINAGIYVLEREVVAIIPPGCAVSSETEFFPNPIGHGFYAVVGDSPLLDIGAPEA